MISLTILYILCMITIPIACYKFNPYLGIAALALIIKEITEMLVNNISTNEE